MYCLIYSLCHYWYKLSMGVCRCELCATVCAGVCLFVYMCVFVFCTSVCVCICSFVDSSCNYLFR